MDPVELINIYNSVPDDTKKALLNPSATAVGEGIGGILLFLCSPFIKLGIYSTGNIESYRKKIESKLNNVSIENYDKEKLPLAYSTLNESMDRINEDELQDMFANLIAGTLNKEVNNSVSPKFKSILSNMSNQEAQLLNKLARTHNREFPVTSISVSGNDGLRSPIANNFISIDLNNGVQNQYALDELIQDGIVQLNNLQSLASEYAKNQYSMAKDFLIMDHDLEKIRNSISADYGVLRLTTFGSDFVRIVCAED